MWITVLVWSAIMLSGVDGQSNCTCPCNATTTTSVITSAPTTAPAGCASADPATWLKLRNDTCQCPWSCINCNGGLPVPIPGQTLAGDHTCACSGGTGTVDCLGCVAGGCGTAGAVCDTSVFVTQQKAYSCLPSAGLQQFFPNGGLFVWGIQFPTADITNNGTATLSCYSGPKGTPLLFDCQFTKCSRSVDSGNQKLICETTVCTPTGFGDTTLQNTVSSLGGTSTVILQTDGSTTMFQDKVGISIQMTCNASGCRFPGDGAIQQSTLEIVLASVFGALIPITIAVIIVVCCFRARALQSKYLNFGKKRVERSLAWSSISCTIRFYVPGKLKKTRKVLEVLKPLSGSASPGTMTALMGESGAGKTALLDMLARRKTFGEMGGEILVNGRQPGEEWKRITGYVLQEDLFTPTQTALEHLTFVSRMKLPAIMTQEERDERVQYVLEAMGLSHVANSMIGDSTHKGLSGGEKKRLSIAAELIADPAILFVDEPTSGLDSVNAFRVMQSLHTLAHQYGKTVIFSIHAPDSALYELFDQVIILAKGHLMFFGPRDELKGAMEKLSNSSCPPHYNPADFAIHVIAKLSPEQLLDRARQISGREFHRASEGAMEMFEMNAVLLDYDEVHQAPSKGDIEATPMEEVVVSTTTEEKNNNIVDEHKEHAEVASMEESDSIGAFNQPWLFQVWYVMKRSFMDSIRNPYLLRLQYILIIGAGLVLGGMFFKMTDQASGAQNRAGLLFFVCTLLMVITLPSIDTFYSERALFLREKGAGYYSSSAYFVAKALADVIPLRLIPPIILTIIVYPMTGLRAGASYFFWFMLICILLSYCSTGMCLLISSLSPSVAVGNLVAILVMLFMLLFGGLLLNQTALPAGAQWLKWLSFINYAFNALAANEFTNLTFYITQAGLSIPISGQFFLNFFGLEPQYFYLDIYLLVIMGTLFYIVSALVLYFMKEKR